MRKPLTVLALPVLLAALGASELALADRHERENDEHDSHERQSERVAPAAPAADPAAAERYRSECGACHLAYPPGLLPSFAWAEIINKLDAHYGDDASLDPETVGQIQSFLAADAADRERGVRARAFATLPVSGGELPRITQTRFFRSEHHEIPLRMVTDNPEVKSFSACQACHGGAEQGRFDEDEVNIPGVGRFED